MELVEPLRLLFKDEVRRVGEELGLPERMVWRQPFPGPGSPSGSSARSPKTGSRCCAPPTRCSRRRCAAPAGTASCGSRCRAPRDPLGRRPGRQRRPYAYPIVIRAVTSEDAMTADWARLPYDLLETISLADHQRDPGGQPRCPGHLVEAAVDDRMGVHAGRRSGRGSLTPSPNRPRVTAPSRLPHDPGPERTWRGQTPAVSGPGIRVCRLRAEGVTGQVRRGRGWSLRPDMAAPGTRRRPPNTGGGLTLAVSAPGLADLEAPSGLPAPRPSPRRRRRGSRVAPRGRTPRPAPPRRAPLRARPRRVRRGGCGPSPRHRARAARPRPGSRRPGRSRARRAGGGAPRDRRDSAACTTSSRRSRRPASARPTTSTPTRPSGATGSGVPRVAAARAPAARRRGGRLPRRAGLRNRVHLRAPAHRERPGRGERHHRPPRPRRARRGRRRPPLERRPDAPGHRDLEPCADVRGDRRGAAIPGGALAGRRVIAVGRVAERALGAPYVRHPSRGGAAVFRLQLARILS